MRLVLFANATASSGAPAFRGAAFSLLTSRLPGLGSALRYCLVCGGVCEFLQNVARQTKKTVKSYFYKISRRVIQCRASSGSGVVSVAMIGPDG